MTALGETADRVWKVDDVHPESGAVCTRVDEHGVPRWKYPAGHPRFGMAERLMGELGRGKGGGLRG